MISLRRLLNWIAGRGRILLVRCEFPKSQLDTLTTDEQVLLVQLGNLLNEISILQKCLQFTRNEGGRPGKPRTSAGRVQGLFFVRILAGKLFDGWEILQTSYFGTQLSRTYDGMLPEDAQAARRALGSYFGKTNLIKTIRDKYAFHSDRSQIEPALGKIGAGEILTLIAGEAAGDNLYDFADIVASHAYVGDVHPDPVTGLTRILDEVLENAGHFQRVCTHLLLLLGAKADLVNAGLLT